MIQFKSTSDLQKLPSDNPAYPCLVVSQLVHSLITSYRDEGYPYDPDADGWVVLIEEGDQNRPLHEIWEGDDTKLSELWWEGFTKEDGHFVGIYLANNQWGLAVVIPDANWVNGKLREVIEKHLFTRRAFAQILPSYMRNPATTSSNNTQGTGHGAPPVQPQSFPLHFLSITLPGG